MAVPACPISIMVDVFFKYFSKTFVSSEFDRFLIVIPLNKYLSINNLFEMLFEPEILKNPENSLLSCFNK